MAETEGETEVEMAEARAAEEMVEVETVVAAMVEVKAAAATVEAATVEAETVAATVAATVEVATVEATVEAAKAAGLGEGMVVEMGMAEEAERVEEAQTVAVEEVGNRSTRDRKQVKTSPRSDLHILLCGTCTCRRCTLHANHSSWHLCRCSRHTGTW